MSAKRQSGRGCDFVDVGCPYCGPHRRSPVNQTRKVMRIWETWDGGHTFYCARCGARGRIGEQRDNRIFPSQPGIPDASTQQRRQVAQTLWQVARQLPGTPAEKYLRVGRGYGGPLPPTLRYLPARGAHPHALIAAFGFVPETSCGELRTPEAPPAVHLTRLSQDALTRLDKIMIGPVSAHPIVLAPVGDGLGLVIAEGIEDALSLHEATGLGAWAAGSAAHMAKLGPEIPDYVTWVTLAEDNDQAGRNGVQALAASINKSGLPVSIMSLAELDSAGRQ